MFRVASDLVVLARVGDGVGAISLERKVLEFFRMSTSFDEISWGR